MRATAVLAGLLWCLAGCAGVNTEALPGEPPPHHVKGGFRNTNPAFARADGWTRWSFMAARAWQSFTAPRTFSAPRVANDGRALRESAAAPTITWVGHATLLVQIDGLTVLTDPQWSDRASPLSWAGPRRLTPPGLAFGDLPKIDVVAISHDHFDHLDVATVTRLAREHDPLFVVPLGIKAWLASVGITRAVELDWWGEHTVRGVRFVCVPAQHVGQRTLFDGGTRLWASWAMLGPTRRFYFAGDTGYFDGFAQMRQRLGAVDLAAVPIGAYEPPRIMRFVHTTPEQAVQVSADVGAASVLAMHWGTFDLAEEPLGEPPVRFRAEARRRGIPDDRAWVLAIGETRRW